MITAGDFRKGKTVEIEGQVYEVIDFLHVKPGKGSPFVRTKLKNVINGGVQEKTFNPSDKFPEARIETKEMEYLYSDGGLGYFMDLESYEQIPMNHDLIADTIKWVKENTTVMVKFYKGEAFSVEPPFFVELEVTDAEPGVRGNTATNVTKPATLETGAVLNVPIFINVGDVIRIDTRTEEYMERVNK